MQIVFVHGWGMAPDFWNALIKQLPEIKTQTIDLGFVGTSQTPQKQIDHPAIYVTHSLGTMWALKHHHADMKALIAINGFACFQSFTDAKTLRAMKARIKREPQSQMNDFWDMCNLPKSDDINPAKLAEGLEWLSSWDAGDALKTLECPVLSLAGSNDPILSMPQMKQEWGGYDLRICEGAGHALPITDTQWCVEQIKAFVNEF